ncbi:MAG: NAD(P)/FAD-dependent oxidoreductase [Rhodomicrobium sp.]
MGKVIVVGGGYAGAALAKRLDPKADVTLVEPRDAFVHNVAAIRALVDPSLLDKIILPYRNLLRRGRVMRERAVAIEDNAVILGSGMRLTADVIAVATGSSYAQPFKPMTDKASDFASSMRAAHDVLSKADRVAIAGAGAVGVELAGEIAAGMKGKQVTLVSASASLFPSFTKGLGRSLEAQLRKLGVTLRLGVNAETSGLKDQPHRGPLLLATGEKIPVDLSVPALGSHPEAGLLRTLDDVTVDPLGRVKVDPWLRPLKGVNLFALGDCAFTGDAMTIVAITRQVPWLAKTILAVLEGTRVEDLAPYTPWPVPPILLPLGPSQGASVLPIGGGVAVGPFLTSAIKGKGLFISKQRKEFGL